MRLTHALAPLFHDARLVLQPEAEALAAVDGVHPVAAARYVVAESIDRLPITR